MVVKLLGNKLNMVVFSKKLFFKAQFFFLVKSFLLQKFINILTRGGKKIKSEKLVLSYLHSLKYFFLACNPILSFFKIIEEVKPSLELVSKRLGKRVYQIPVPIRPHRQYSRCLRWLKMLLIKSKCSKNVFELLLQEHIFILRDKSKSLLLKKKQQIFTISFDNRMFTHFR